MTMTTDVRPSKKSGRPPAPPKHGPNGKTPFDLNNLLYALQAVKVGDFSVRMAGDQLGIEGKIADAFNEIVAANERMAKILAEKGYHYQFVFARNAVHVGRAVRQQTLPEALQYLWQGYPVTAPSK